MPVICSTCAYENPGDSGFCARCGNRLPSNGQTSTGATASSQPFPAYAHMGTPGYSTPPPTPSYGPPPGPSYPAYTPASQVLPPASAYPMQMGTGQGLVSIRRAFAGCGTLIHHHSWLVNGGSEQAGNARSTIFDILRQRNIAGFNVADQRLTERGLLMEQRDYLVARRGVTTVFIYASPAGKDLYISRATTVLPTINNVRVVIFCLLLLAMLIGFFVHPSPSTPTSIFSGDMTAYLVAGFVSFLFTLVGFCILLFFIYLLVRSCIYWLVEKDFLVLLRYRDLNDFQIDDVMVLEHVTDDTVKAAVKQVGLDASQITPPPMGYEAKRRIRTI
jgi:hypothetical protein